MISFDLLTKFIEDPEALIRRTRAKLKKVLALKSEDNHIRQSLTPEFEAMADKTLHEFSTPTTANIYTGPNVNCWRQWIRAQASSHQHGASKPVSWKGT